MPKENNVKQKNSVKNTVEFILCWPANDVYKTYP